MNDKSLFELFRRNEYKLNERPSPRAWDRLERRLDQHRRRPLHSLRRTLSMVASLAILVTLLFLLTLIGKNDFNQKSAAYKPKSFEGLATNEKSTNETSNLVALSHQYYNTKVTLPEKKLGKKRIIAKTQKGLGD